MRRLVLLALAVPAALRLLTPERRRRLRVAVLSRVPGGRRENDELVTSEGVASVGPVEKQDEPPAPSSESPGTSAPAL